MDLETVLAHQQRKTNHNPDTLRHLQQLGVAASTLNASPEWKVYADHLESLKQGFERKRIAHEGKLVGGATLPHDEYVELKRQLAIATASERCFDMALKIVETLITNGEAAAKSLTISE